MQSRLSEDPGNFANLFFGISQNFGGPRALGDEQKPINTHVICRAHIGISHVGVRW